MSVKTLSVPLHVLRYRTRWSSVVEDGTNAKAPSVASLKRVMELAFGLGDIGDLLSCLTLWSAVRGGQGEAVTCCDDLIHRYRKSLRRFSGSQSQK